eukprot:1323266-Amorphochlora_amoeboformis.AAC.2
MRAELILEPLGWSPLNSQQLLILIVIIGFTLSRMQYNNMLKLLEDVSQQDEKPTQLPDYNEKPTNEGRDKVKSPRDLPLRKPHSEQPHLSSSPNSTSRCIKSCSKIQATAASIRR